MGKNYTKYTYTTSECHTGQNAVFEIGKAGDAEHYILYAGGRNRSGGWWKQPLAELAMGPSETMTPTFGKALGNDATTVPDGFTCAQHIPVYEPPLIVSLDFPDFGVPTVPKEFWYALADDIRSHKITHISMQCAGGHGRTGVQLCIMLCLLAPASAAKMDTAMDVLKYVRDTYCDHAIETLAQLEYVANVIDKPVGEGFSSHKSTGAWNGGGASGKAHGGSSKTTFEPLTDPCKCKKPTRAVDHAGIAYCKNCQRDIVELTPKDHWENEDRKAKRPSEAKKESKKEWVCPCCKVVCAEHAITVTKPCPVCSYVPPTSALLNKTQECAECGLDVPLIEFIDDDDVCIQCMGRYEQHINVKCVPHGDIEVACGVCNVMYPIDCIHGYSMTADRLNTPECFVCWKKNGDN